MGQGHHVAGDSYRVNQFSPMQPCLAPDSQRCVSAVSAGKDLFQSSHQHLPTKHNQQSLSDSLSLSLWASHVHSYDSATPYDTGCLDSGATSTRMLERSFHSDPDVQPRARSCYVRIFFKFKCNFDLFFHPQSKLYGHDAYTSQDAWQLVQLIFTTVHLDFYFFQGWKWKLRSICMWQNLAIPLFEFRLIPLLLVGSSLDANFGHDINIASQRMDIVCNFLLQVFQNCYIHEENAYKVHQQRNPKNKHSQVIYQQRQT